MIDEPRVVPAGAAVDAGVVVEREQEGVVTIHGVVVVATIGLVVGDALAGVFDDARALADLPDGERSAALNGGATQLEITVGRLWHRCDGIRLQ